MAWRHVESIGHETSTSPNVRLSGSRGGARDEGREGGRSPKVAACSSIGNSSEKEKVQSARSRLRSSESQRSLSGSPWPIHQGQTPTRESIVLSEPGVVHGVITARVNPRSRPSWASDGGEADPGGTRLLVGVMAGVDGASKTRVEATSRVG